MPPVPGTLSAMLTALWADVASLHSDLPATAIVALSSTPPSSAHAPERWSVDQDGTLTGLTVGVSTLSSGGLETIAYVLHEAAHVLCWRRGIKDTSSGGIYHNARFLAAAEEVGLTWPAGVERSPRRGADTPVLTDASAAFWEPHAAVLSPGIEGIIPYLATPAKARQRPSRVNAECRCEPPRKIRVSATVLDLGPIVCGVCAKEFEPTE